MIHARALIEIACKLLGLVFLTWGINTSAFIPEGLSMLQNDDATEKVIQEDEAELMLQDEDEDENEMAKTIAIYRQITMPIFYFIFAFVFLKYAPVIAEKLDHKDLRISIFSRDDWLQVLYHLGILLIGIYMVVLGVPRVLRSGSAFLAYDQVSLIPTPIWGGGIASLVYLALGFHLLSGGSLVMKVKNIANQNGD